MIERWALVSGLKGDLDTYELIQKDLKNSGNITFVLGDMIGPENCNRLLHRLINPKKVMIYNHGAYMVGGKNKLLGKWLPW